MRGKPAARLDNVQLLSGSAQWVVAAPSTTCSVSMWVTCRKDLAMAELETVGASHVQAGDARGALV